MTHPDADRSGVLVIRVWYEAGDGPQRFRARITSMIDVDRGGESVAVTASADEVVEHVRAWLRRVDTTRRIADDAV